MLKIKSDIKSWNIALMFFVTGMFMHKVIIKKI